MASQLSKMLNFHSPKNTFFSCPVYPIFRYFHAHFFYQNLQVVNLHSIHFWRVLFSPPLLWSCSHLKLKTSRNALLSSALTQRAFLGLAAWQKREEEEEVSYHTMSRCTISTKRPLSLQEAHHDHVQK